jgi:arginyl-tRNA synthetase
MNSLKRSLSQVVSSAFASLDYDPSHGQVVESARPDLAQFQCNGALEAARARGEKPRDIALAVVERLRAAPDAAHIVGRLEVAGPGFINIDASDGHLVERAAGMARDARLGCGAVAAPLRILIDYGGANIAKPMHVGHLRSSIIGESLKRITRFVGHDTVGDFHLGDWGLQMGMLIAELARRQPGLPYFDADRTSAYPTEVPVTIEDLQQLYPEASRRAKESPEAMEQARRATMELQAGRPGYRALWQHFRDVSVAELRADSEALGVSFDLWLGESDVEDLIPHLVERLKASGHAVESQGALVIEVAEPDDTRQLPPLILTKTDGAVLYGTTDLATIERRVQGGMNAILYVVDNRQSDHFVQVFRAARRTGIAPPDVVLEHVAFGTMNGADGKPFKTREGGVMRLKDLMESVTSKARERMSEAEVAVGYPEAETAQIALDVGLAALKYADLMNHRTRDYVFDLERFSSFDGKTGPYLLYATVRIKSILRKAAERGLEPGALAAPASDAERRLLLVLAKFPDVVTAAFEARAPNYVAEFTYELATTFNRFYADHHILSEPDAGQRGSWLTLVGGTARMLEQSLELLGLGVPERM